MTPMMAYRTILRWSEFNTAAAAAERVYMVKELGRREVDEVNRPELMQSSRRKKCAAFWLMWRHAALQYSSKALRGAGCV